MIDWVGRPRGERSGHGQRDKEAKKNLLYWGLDEAETMTIEFTFFKILQIRTRARHRKRLASPKSYVVV